MHGVTCAAPSQRAPCDTERERSAIIRYREYRSSPLLRPYVECYWTAQCDARQSLSSREILLPDGTTQLLLSVTGAYRRFDGPDAERGVRIDGSHLVGMRISGVFIEQQEVEDVFAIRFRAGGLSPFLGMPVAETVHQSISLDCLLGAAAAELEGKVIEARTASERIEIVERMLLHRLERSDAMTPTHRAVRRAVRHIYAARGAVSMDRLGAAVGMGHRALDRAFGRHVGIAPKRLSRIVRFNYALSLMQQHPQASHSRVALEAGYADQPHMIRDFREFTHSAPSDFLARRYGIVEVSRSALRNRLSNSFNTQH